MLNAGGKARKHPTSVCEKSTAEIAGMGRENEEQSSRAACVQPGMLPYCPHYAAHRSGHQVSPGHMDKLDKEIRDTVVTVVK